MIVPCAVCGKDVEINRIPMVGMCGLLAVACSREHWRRFMALEHCAAEDRRRNAEEIRNWHREVFGG